MTTLLYVVFVLSGAAGLMYESIWSRYLGLFVGHSAYAQIIVLTIFLGGMSLGAVLAGERSERLREPLVAYAAVEALAGVLGIVFHDVFLAVTRFAYDSMFPALAGSGALLVVKWTIAGLLILPQSVLLGMTFPLMSAGVLRLASARPGHVLAMLYFANSLGAAVGVLVAGFYLIAVAGLPGTLLAAGSINLGVALATFIGVRIIRPPQGLAYTTAPASVPASAPASALPSAPASAPPAAPGAPGISLERLWRLLLFVSFATAVASFIYEISWIRMLSLVLGSATHSFELMLSAFILGLALGALWSHRRADRFADPMRALGVVQWLMGFAALATLPIYLASFHWTQSLLAALQRSEQGYAIFTLARYAFCLAVMLPATFFAGITLPLITKMLLVAGKGERAIGAVYAVNTLGSIVGVILAGLVFLPLIGLKSLLVEGAIIDMALGVLLLRVDAGTSPRARWLAYGAAVVMAAAGLASLAGNRFDQAVLTSGVFRYGSVPEPGTREVVFYRDGRTATVSVTRAPEDKHLYISTNGKPDASLDTIWFTKEWKAPPQPLGGDVSTQVLLPLMTLAHAPRARTAAVIGQGSGMTSHFLLGSPALEQLVTIEIEPQMIEGSRLFYPANRRVFDDRRSRFVIDDAKSYFASAGRTYDLIISEPSNPWVSGVSGLFTTEFYERVRRYLSPNGVFGQWLHLYEINDGLVLSVLAALHKNFPAYEVFLTSSTDMLIVAGKQPQLPTPDWLVVNEPAIAQDLRRAVPLTPRALEGMRLLNRDALRPLLDRWAEPNSDFYPVLDLGAERARYLRRSAVGFGNVTDQRFDMIAPFIGRRVPFDTATIASVPGIPRLHGLAVGAMLRERRLGMFVDSSRVTDAIPALYRRWRFTRALASNTAPTDWHQWLSDAQVVESDLHGGTAGVADEEFYGSLYLFMNRHAAPRGAREAVEFMHALAAWDFPAASRAADNLLPDAVKGVSWIPVDDLREGATVAKLRTGDVQGAKRFWRTLASRATRSRDDLRAMFVEARILGAK